MRPSGEKILGAHLRIDREIARTKKIISRPETLLYNPLYG